MRGCEGAAAKRYFDFFPMVLPENWEWHGRNRRIMGHGDISVTLDTYTHADFDDAWNEMQRVTAANAIKK